MDQTKGEVKIQQAGGARVRKSGRSNAPLIALAAAAAIAVGVYGGLCAVAVHGGSLWKGTQILGQDVGGMTREEAIAAVESSLDGQEIGLYLYDGSAEPERGDAPDASISLAELGAEVDVPALVDQAKAETQSGSVLTAGWRYLTNKGTSDYSLGEHLHVDAAKTAAAAEAAANELSWAAQDCSYTMTDSTIQIQMAQDGRSVSAQAIQTALSQGAWDADMGLDVANSMVSGQNLSAQ